jgi:PAS domain-containing protein/DNA-binding CsgD family transcriptional regulator
MATLGALAIFKDSDDAIVAFTEDGVCLYANEAALRLYRAPDLVGRPLDELRPSGTAALAAAQWGRFRQDGSLEDELEIQLPDGGRAHLQFRAVADYLPGVHLAVVRPRDNTNDRGRTATLTRLQTPGILFRAAFENSPQACLIADGDRRFVAGNRAARRFLGISAEELTKRRVDDFAPPEVRPELERVWARFLERGALQGFCPMMVAHELRRTVQFTAKAGIAPGRHMSVFSAAPPNRQQAELVLSDGAGNESLSPREREVLTLLARGASGESVAEYTELSPETVRTHVRNAMKKLDAHSRSHAVALAMKRREIDP